MSRTTVSWWPSAFGIGCVPGVAAFLCPDATVLSPWAQGGFRAPLTAGSLPAGTRFIFSVGLALLVGTILYKVGEDKCAPPPPPHGGLAPSADSSAHPRRL